MFHQLSQRFFFFAILLGICCFELAAQDKGTEKEKAKERTKAREFDRAEMERWLAALNSKEFVKREKAVEKLIENGRPTLQFLKELDRSNATPQTMFRVERVESAIKSNLSGFINLGTLANHKLTDRVGRFDGNTLDSLPRGIQKFGEVQFKVGEGALVLGSRYTKKEILGVSIKKKCGQIHFLHAMQQGTGIKDGEKIGKHLVHYSDGKTEEIPIVYGEDLRDWWDADGSKKVSRGIVGWKGNNRSAKSAGHSIRLYVSTWKNPRPDQEVVKIDFVQTHSTAAPFCVAITANSESKK